MSDGEFQEGQTWEAFAAFSFHRLDNICVYVDLNGQQCDGPMSEVMEVEPLAARLKGPLTRHIEEQLESGSLRESVRRAVREVAERLIRQRIQELEDEAGETAAPEDR